MIFGPGIYRSRQKRGGGGKRKKGGGRGKCRVCSGSPLPCSFQKTKERKKKRGGKERQRQSSWCNLVIAPCQFLLRSFSIFKKKGKRKEYTSKGLTSVSPYVITILSSGKKKKRKKKEEGKDADAQYTPAMPLPSSFCHARHRVSPHCVPVRRGKKKWRERRGRQKSERHESMPYRPADYLRPMNFHRVDPQGKKKKKEEGKKREERRGEKKGPTLLSQLIFPCTVVE